MATTEHSLVVAVDVPCVYPNGNVVTFRVEQRVVVPFEGGDLAVEGDMRRVSFHVPLELPDVTVSVPVSVALPTFGRHERVQVETEPHMIRDDRADGAAPPVVNVNVEPTPVTIWNTLEQPPREVKLKRGPRGELVSATVTDK